MKVILILAMMVFMINLTCSKEINTVFQKVELINGTLDTEIKEVSGKVREIHSYEDGTKYYHWQAEYGDILADIAWEEWKGKYTFKEIMKIDESITNADKIYDRQLYIIPVLE